MRAGRVCLRRKRAGSGADDEAKEGEAGILTQSSSKAIANIHLTVGGLSGICYNKKVLQMMQIATISRNMVVFSGVAVE